MIPLRHVPALFIATTFTFGGALPLFNPRRATEEFGLSQRIATSKEANEIFKVYGSRMTMMGLMIYTFYYKQMYSSIDILMTTLGWAGLVDGYICWRDDLPGPGVYRVAAGSVLATLGWFGLNAGGLSTAA